ncbi:hypothetical protein HN954_01085 [bacterium]|jgi:hypothetical protein|nr:hypothetical protein [bacterium]MBT6831798.1 hypothetical protein [bacterium]MBT6996005.1 hypothetical protein [bacterium]MBT7772624.1 hypothetical protein [bacterium]
MKRNLIPVFLVLCIAVGVVLFVNVFLKKESTKNVEILQQTEPIAPPVPPLKNAAPKETPVEIPQSEEVATNQSALSYQTDVLLVEIEDFYKNFPQKVMPHTSSETLVDQTEIARQKIFAAKTDQEILETISDFNIDLRDDLTQYALMHIIENRNKLHDKNKNALEENQISKKIIDTLDVKVYQVWEYKTGVKWRSARQLGYTDGSYDSNLKLYDQMKDPNFVRDLRRRKHELQKN